jgi:hypothetical protein
MATDLREIKELPQDERFRFFIVLDLEEKAGRTADRLRTSKPI